MTNLFANPYYDDFDPAKNFYQVLFRPGYAVQSRELTQLQSILRDQISKFGNHVFKHGSVVIPGNINSDQNICYVKLTGNITLSGGITLATNANLVGLTVTDASNRLKAIIRAYIPAEGSDPATLYISYYNSGSDGAQVFSTSKTLTITGMTSPTTAATAATGGSTMAFLNAGVYFINGTFVSVAEQSVVVEKYSSTPSKHVLLRIDETIVDSDVDYTLLDPAQGSYNFSAPGADRLKISLTLVALPLGTAFSGADYVELIRFNLGNIEEHSRYPKYNELEKTLARRTYEESGDYVASGLKLYVREHLRNQFNDGLYGVDLGGTETRFVYSVSPGKAYIQGYESERLSNTNIEVNKARTSGVISANIVPSYGQYLYVTGMNSLPDFSTREIITFKTHTGGTTITTARAMSIDFHEAGPDGTAEKAIYRLYISDVASFDTTQIGYVSWASGFANVLNKLSVNLLSTADFAYGDAYGTAATVHKCDRSMSAIYVRRSALLASAFPVVGSITTTGSASAKINAISGIGRGSDNNLILKVPSAYTKSVTNSGTTDISYKTFYRTSVTTNGSGTATFSVSNMTIDVLEGTWPSTSNFIAVNSAGVFATGVSIAGNGLSATITGANSTTYQICCAVTKSGSQAQRRTKTFVSVSNGTFTAASTINLNVYDVIRVNSITTAAGEDVTRKYALDNGQRDYAYLYSKLNWVSTDAVPTGNLTIKYDYFTHGSGDYFDIDSYASSGMTDYYTSTGLSYDSAGMSYTLQNCLDFRPTASDVSGNFSGTALPIINDQRISTSVTVYLGRKDAIVLDKSSNLMAICGTPALNPLLPTIPPGVLHLYTASVHPYTKRAVDVGITTINNRGYTMKDVAKLETRIANLEEYVTLSQVESDTVDYNITDPVTGLPRFKAGYLIDTFDNADKISDINNPNFCAMYVGETIVPWFEVNEEILDETSSDLQRTGNALTLPYQEVKLAEQPVSSKVTNINPFAVFNWTGDLRISPSIDTWIEYEELQPVVNNVTETVNLLRTNWDSGLYGPNVDVRVERFAPDAAGEINPSVTGALTIPPG